MPPNLPLSANKVLPKVFSESLVVDNHPEDLLSGHYTGDSNAQVELLKKKKKRYQ